MQQIFREKCATRSHEERFGQAQRDPAEERDTTSTTAASGSWASTTRSWRTYKEPLAASCVGRRRRTANSALEKIVATRISSKRRASALQNLSNPDLE